jgi:hypothetical protein
MADLKISQLPDTTTANVADVFPFTQFGITKKINFGNLNNALPLYTFVRSNSASWLGGGGGIVDSAEFQINGNTGLFNTLNGVEYIVPWNFVGYQTDSSAIEADDILNNMVIKRTGFYIMSCRYSSYDLNDPNVDYLRIRLRGNPLNPITTISGGSLIETIDEGFIRTNENGRCTAKGTTILYISQVPYYLALTFLHSGGAGTGGTTAYPVFENSQGTIPYMRVARLI